jgi:hypothetical protein
MPFTIHIENIQLGCQHASEDACLERVNGSILAVLVPLAMPEADHGRRSWYLEIGFGPCSGEGLVFPTLDAAAAWMAARAAACWSKTPLKTA